MTRGLTTAHPGMTLGVKTADCLPVFFVDPVFKMVGLAHAGWKGVKLGIVKEMVYQMGTDVLVAIGPSIRSCHYFIHKERREELLQGPDILPEHFKQIENQYRADLQAMVLSQLLCSGIPQENIDDSAPCTACEQDRFFSYHLSQDPDQGMLSVIGIQA